MLSGHKPFAAESAAATFSAILSHDPPLLKARPDVPPELQRIVRKCLEKDRERRYQSARELWGDLSNLERDSSSRSVAERTASQQRRNHRRFAVAAVVIVLALSGAGLYRHFLINGASTNTITSIAVLPLTNPSGNPDTESVSDGITEDIIDDLKQLSGLKVMSRGTVFRYKGMDDAQEVGRNLGVPAVLTVRAEERGGAFAIRAELVNVADGSLLWSYKEKDNRKPDVFKAQEEIALQISDALKLKLSGEDERRLAKHYTENTEAYKLYLQGRYYVYKYTDFGTAIDYFNKAIASDRNYALPYAGLGEAYFHAADFLLAPAIAMPKAGEAAREALRIDPSLAEGHVAMGCYLAYYEWNWPEAEKEFRKAIELNPNLPTAYHEYGVFLGWKGRADEADAQMKKALELDPVSVMINTDYGMTLYCRREADRAIDQYLNAIKLDDTFVGSQLYLGLAYDQKHDYAKAEDELRKAYDNSGGIAVTVAAFGRLYADQGKKAEAEKVLKQLEDMKKKSYVSSYYIAFIYSGLGDKDQAIQWLSRAYDEKSDYLVYLNVLPLLDDLREEPGFKELVRRVGL